MKTWITKSLIGFAVFAAGEVAAQSNLKEGNNALARYTKSGDFKQLLEARKFSDQAFIEKRDSVAYENNLLRGMVYSSLAVADSNRSQSYKKDPIEESEFMLARLNDKQMNFENQPKIDYIRERLASAYLINANRSLSNNNAEDAYQAYEKVSMYSRNDSTIRYNLAVLSERLDKPEQAIGYYEQFLQNKETARANYVLRLSNIYLKRKDNNSARNTLMKGRSYFPKNKDILFKLINLYASNGAYDAIVPLSEEALAYEPENVQLNYLIGYAHEVTGKRVEAERYYKRALELNPDDYNSNYELGLLYLRDFIDDDENLEKQYTAQEYLLKANEIDPNAVNALKSLAVLFTKAGNELQLERVKSQLNQISIN